MLLRPRELSRLTFKVEQGLAGNLAGYLQDNIEEAQMNVNYFSLKSIS